MSVSQSFLENTYLHKITRDVLRSYVAKVPSTKTKTIIDTYRQVIQHYSFAEMEKEGRVPQSLLDELASIGIFGLSIPSKYQGQGLPLTQYLYIVDQMARDDFALALVPLAHLSIGVKGILLFGNREQKEKYLPPAASGRMIFAYALTEPMHGSDAQHIETTATLSEDGSYYLLKGSKTYITNGNYAGGLTVFAQLDPGRPGFMGAFIVETAWDGVTIGKDMPKMGLGISSTTSIIFKDVLVPVSNMLGQPGDGFKIAMTILNYGRLGLGAGSHGALCQSIDDMLKRASQRIQFGVPILEFPLVQEKIIQAKVDSLLIESMTAFTAHLLEEDPHANVALESSHCKLFGTTRAWKGLYEALQVAGGAGYLKTQPYEKRMRDFRVTTVFEGTSEIHTIYPPVYLMKSMVKHLKRNGFVLFRFLSSIWSLIAPVSVPVRCRHPVMKKGKRQVRRNLHLVRRMMLKNILLKGKKAFTNQLFLRRITSLSIETYAIMTVLATLQSNEGKHIDGKEGYLLLEYFLEQCKEQRTNSYKHYLSRKDRIHEKIMRTCIRADE